MADNLPPPFAPVFGGGSANGSNAMPRRSSYASVVAGGSAASPSGREQQQSARANALARLAENRYPMEIPVQPAYRTYRTPGAPTAWFVSPLASAAFDQYARQTSVVDRRIENRRPVDLPPHSVQFGFLETGSSVPGVTGNGTEAFLTPSYLRDSRYIERLADAHRTRLLKQQQREALAGPDANGHTLSTSSSSVNLHKMAPSHRGMTYDIVEKEPRPPADGLPPLPSRWNEMDRYGGIEIAADGLEVKFVGPGKSHEHIEAAAVRADHPMSPQCGLYYYEVTIVSKGKEGTIGIGYSTSRVSLNRLPGWEPESWAYHGDDGRSFCCSSTGKDYGPHFETGDVIGCGLNFRTGCGFFTRNGIHLGNAFREVKGRLFPSIGMKRPGEHIKANFGQTPFVFDIDGMMAMEKFDLQKQIDQTSTAGLHPNMDETALVQAIVAQYLAHEGYVETAEAFAQELHAESNSLKLNRSDDVVGSGSQFQLEPDVHHRQEIRKAILDGDIDKAFERLETYFPTVLKENEQIYFRLRCMKFIEMIRQCSELNLIAQGTSGKQAEDATNGHQEGEYDDVFENEMEMDDQMVGGSNWDQMETEETEENEEGAAEDSDASAKHINLLQETIKYGQVLRSEFRDDPRKEVKKALEETFSVWAYEDPKKSVVAHLLEPSGRAPVADELNSAILVSLGKSATSALERIYQETEVLIADISDEGGAGAFINVKKDYLQ